MTEVVVGLILCGCMWAYAHLLRAAEERESQQSEYARLLERLQMLEDSSNDLEAKHEWRERRIEDRIATIEQRLIELSRRTI